MDKTKKILITGGAGFIGYHLAKTLALQNSIPLLFLRILKLKIIYLEFLKIV